LSDLELVGARMYTPSDKFLDEYIKTIEMHISQIV